MELWIHQTIAGFPFWALLVVLVFFICLLSKGADILVEEAVALSVRLNVPPMLIGATVVSLGTTLPEAAVSVMAALGGNPGLALGNAVGSVICDTGLILGIGALMKPLPINRHLVNRQGWIQFAAGVMLVAACYPWSHPSQVLTEGGHLPQKAGIFFVACLVIYFIWSYRMSRKGDDSVNPEEVDADQEKDVSTVLVLLKLVIGIVLVVLSSKVLIPTASEMAVRMSIPEGVIAASLVAFGTSLPELITVITSVRKGHADLAIGNVVGADILNVFFVVGVSGAVTKGGLIASSEFFTHLFPFMLAVLIIFRAGIFFSKKALGRFFGVLLLLFYLIFLYVNYGA
jgi:cation:H+ antiporter